MVVEKILESNDLVPLPSEDYHISVHPCYNNFHEYIGQKIHDEVSNAINIVEEVKEEAQEDMEEGAQKEMEENTEGEDGSDKDDVSDEEDTDKSDNNGAKTENKNKDDDDTSETDSSEESSSDREYRETTSRPRSSAVRGGFRGRGAEAVIGGHAASSARRKSNEEIRKDTVKSNSSSSNKSSHKDKDPGSKYERTSGKVGYTRGVGKTRGTQLHTLSTPSHDEGICDEMKSEVSKINTMKSPNGRGGTICHFNESEIHAHWNVDAPIFMPDMNKQHSTSYTSLENFDRETSSFTAGRRPQEETLGAASFNQNLIAIIQAFQKVEQESKNKFSSEIEKRDAIIKQLEEELAKKTEQSKQSIEKIDMASWQKEFLSHCFGNFEDCRVTFDGSFAIVEGKPENVREQQLKLLKELAKLKEQPLEITPTMYSILCKKDGHEYLLNLNTNHLNGVKVFLHDKSLSVVATSDLALKDAMDFLNDEFNYKETIISEAEMPTEKLQCLKLSLEEKFLVKISWHIKKREIYVEGIKDDVSESIREIRTLMLEHMVTSSFTAEGRPQEETLGAASFNQKLFANKQAFQKVGKERKSKLSSELEMRDAKIKQLEEELAKKTKQSKQSIEKIEMAPWQKDFLPHCFGNFDNCRINFDGSFAIVEGKPESVKEQQLKLMKELVKLKEQPLEISPTMHSILCKKDGQQYLLNLSTTHLNGVKVFLHDKSLLLVATSALALKDAMDFLNDKLNYKETSTCEAEIPTEKLQFLQLSLEDKFLVKVSWDIKKREIYVEGIKDDVFESIREIRTLILEHMDQEKSFVVSGLHAKLLQTFYEDQIKQCLQTVETVDYSSTEADIVIQFKGDRKFVQQVHRKLTELQTKVMVKSWDVRSEFKKLEELMLIAKGFVSDKMKKKIHSFEVSNKCIVSHKLPSLEHFKIGTPKKTQPAHHSPSKFRERPQTEQTETKIKLKINDTCELVVKPYGDITKEGSDVLVNVLTTHIDLRKTRVGISFNKACSSLWKSLEAEKEAHPSDPVLTTNGPFSHLKKCQAICHMVFTPWDPNSSPAQLSTAIQLVITKAVALGAKSISFPVLGCGRALGFPPSDVADITLTCIKSHIGQAFQKVVLLAPDKELYKEFKSKVSKHFQLSPAKVAPVQVVGATSSSGLDVTAEDDEDDVSEESDDEEFAVEVLQQDVNNSHNPEISITVLHGIAIENMWSDLKQTIIKVCLHTQYFNQDIVNYWPKDSRHRILQMAKKLCVWVERSPNPKTKMPGFIIKGEKQPVEKVHKTINEEFSDISSHLPKNRKKSSKAPKRGTDEFLKHAAESDEVFPSYWKLNALNPDTNAGTHSWKKLKGALGSHKPENHLVNIDSETKEAIKKLVKKTWDPIFVGHGNDAAGLSHSKIKVIDVKRIENKHLFELYSAQRKSLFRRMYFKKLICTDIEKIRGSKGRIVTTENLEDFMKEELYYEVNEHYLFYGTKTPDAIAANGIDPRVSSEGGIYGKGIYTAEKFTKSDQYTDSRSRRTAPGTTLYMILARVLLGNVFLCDHNHPSVASKQATKLTRPPCVQCKNDICTCVDQELFDSVMGDGKWIFREFVVYDRFQCYPEYLISYQREA